jgi:hypothetical protein
MGASVNSSGPLKEIDGFMTEMFEVILISGELNGV